MAMSSFTSVEAGTFTGVRFWVDGRCVGTTMVGSGLLPPNTSGINSNSLSYFHNGATFSLGLIIEG